MYNERKTIYVRDEKVWNEICSRAKDKGIAISKLLIEAVIGPAEKSQLDRIEEKLDRGVLMILAKMDLRTKHKLEHPQKKATKVKKIPGLSRATETCNTEYLYFNPQPKKEGK